MGRNSLSKHFSILYALDKLRLKKGKCELCFYEMCILGNTFKDIGIENITECVSKETKLYIFQLLWKSHLMSGT